MSRAVLTGCDARFAEGVRGLLRSVKRFHPEAARYCVVPPGEEHAVRAELGDLATVLPQPRPVRGVPDHWLPQLFAARVFMTSFPEEHVAWVDGDVVFCRRADELFDVPPGRVNVVRDAVYNLGRMVAPNLWGHYAKQFGRAPDEVGFNAGIHALRKSDWPDLPERFERVVAEGGYPYYKTGFEQALLNGLFLPHANWLPRPFNAHALFELGEPADPRLLHYTASPKPWMPGYRAHWPGYAAWREFADGCGPVRAAWLRLYYRLAAPRRLGYRAARKVLTRLGVMRHAVGVADGPG